MDGIFLHRHHSATSIKRGVPPDKVEALNRWQTSSHFTDRERVCLEYAEAVTLRSNTISEGLIEQLHKHFDDDGIVENGPDRLSEPVQQIQQCPWRSSPGLLPIQATDPALASTNRV